MSFKGFVRLLRERLQTLFGADVELVFGDDLAPTLEQVFLARAVEPEFSFRRRGVGFGVNPFALRKVLDGVRDFRLFERHGAKSFIPRRERRIESRRTRADDDEIEHRRVARFRVGLGGDVLEDLKSLRHRVLDDRGARQIADDVKAGNVALSIFLQGRTGLRHVGAGEDDFEFFLGLVEHIGPRSASVESCSLSF